MLGISKVTTKSERSFDDMRLDDVLSLSNPVKLDNIIFKDSFKISFGDNPVRCSEMGQNKSGRYRVCSLPLNIDEFYSFKDLLSHKHLTINEKRAIACKGNVFDSDKNNEVNLQEINSSSYCRSVSIPFTDAKDAAMKQSPALCGIKSTPAMLSKHPYIELGLLNLNEWDVLPMEVLHDIKGLVKKSFECVPGSIHLGDDNVIKSAHAIIHKSGDELFLLKDKHSAESLAKAMVDICRNLEKKILYLWVRCSLF